jgi:hypothetical protein
MAHMYKEKILKDINDIPLHKFQKFCKIVHLLKNELMRENNQVVNRRSLRGIWKESNSDDDLIDKSKKSLFYYE